MSEQAQPKEINENTATAPEVIEQAAGDTYTNFDELDVVQSAAKKQSTETKKEETKTEENKDDNKKEAAKEESDKTETKEDTEKEEESDNKDTKELIKESLKRSSEKNTEKEKLKEFEARIGEDLLKINANAEFQVTVDGKPVKANLQELVNNYSGATHLRQQVTKLREEQRSFEKDRQDIQSAIDGVYEQVVVKGDPFGGISTLAELMGADPLQVIENLRNQIAPIIEQDSKLTEEEKKIRDLETRLQFVQKKTEAATKAKQAKDIESIMEQRAMAVLKEKNMDKETFSRLYSELMESGQVTIEQITPELIGDYYTDITTTKSLSDMLSDVNPDLPQEDRSKAIKEMKQLMSSPVGKGLTVDNFREIAIEVYGSKAAKALSRKIKQANPISTSKQKPQADDVWSFDQI